MAKLVMAAATPHNPLLWRAMVEPIPDDLVGVAANFARIRDTITELGVDVAIVIGTDHIRQFFFDNSPAFIIGQAERYHGTYENEVRTFGMEYVELTGHRELADPLGRSRDPAVRYAGGLVPRGARRRHRPRGLDDRARGAAVVGHADGGANVEGH